MTADLLFSHTFPCWCCTATQILINLRKEMAKEAKNADLLEEGLRAGTLEVDFVPLTPPPPPAASTSGADGSGSDGNSEGALSDPD